MKKRFVILGMLIATVMAFNSVGVLTAAASVNVDDGKEISIIKEADKPYTVQGVVAAANTRGVVITDGTAGVMIYGSAILDQVVLGDYIEISATSSEYNNLLQLNYNSESVVTKLDKANAPKEPNPTPLDATVAQGWKDKADQDPSGLSVTDVKPYSWTATATRVGSYWALTPEWATDLGFDIEPLYVNTSNFNLQTGVEYDVVGYFIGFNNTSTTPFAGMMLKTLSTHGEQLEIVVNKPYVAVDYNTETLALDVTLKNATTDLGYTVTSSDDTVASWDATSKMMIIGEAGTVTLTVSALEAPSRTATITLVVYQEELGTIAELTEGTYLIVGTVVAKTTNAVIVADSSGGVMVYDIKQIADLKENDVVSVAGTVSQYNGLWQFSYNPGVVIQDATGNPYKPTAIQLKENSDLEDVIKELKQEDVKLYSWTGVAGLRNGYNIFNIDYDGVVIESEVALANVELGTTYNFEGYFVGYNANNSYASFVIKEPLQAATQQKDYLGFNRDTINLGVESTYTLSPIVGGAAKDTTISYEIGGDEGVITLVDGVITGIKAGTATITASAAGISRTITVYVSNAISQVTTPNQFYTVIGKVVAKTTQSIVIHDGTAGILVYDRDVVAKYNLNDVIQVSGYVSLFNNMLQFSYNGNLDTKKVDQTINVLAAKPLTKEIADGWATLESPILPINCQEYTWTAKVAKSGNYFTINFEGSNTVIEPAYMPDNFTLTEDETVTVTGYFIGYSTSSKYAAIAITNVVHAQS